MRFFFTILGLLSFIGLSKISAQTVTDIDGNIYNTVTIGTQIWMKENLKTTKYSDGSVIPNITNNLNWQNLTTGARCYSNNDSTTNASVYGALYNWYAVANNHKICPINWHVSSDADWNILEIFLDNSVDTTAMFFVGTDIGAKLKEAGTVHWDSPNVGATNSSSFSALPGSNRSYDGPYPSIGGFGYWWSSTEANATEAWYRIISYDNAVIFRHYGKDKSYGFSVRCIRDLTTNIENLNNLQNINIYPNPANDKIEIIGINNGIIELINMQGQVVKTANLLITKTILDISKLSSGFYAVKIIANNGIIVKKIIKQ